MAIKHTIRSKDGGTQTITLTPLKAIRLCCLECVGWSALEVRECTSPLCPLYPFRMGKGHTGRKGNVKSLKKPAL
jgi:hypothetical protein